jgi:hypothetical protein
MIATSRLMTSQPFTALTRRQMQVEKMAPKEEVLMMEEEMVRVMVV